MTHETKSVPPSSSAEPAPPTLDEKKIARLNDALNGAVKLCRADAADETCSIAFRVERERMANDFHALAGALPALLEASRRVSETTIRHQLDPDSRRIEELEAEWDTFKAELLETHDALGIKSLEQNDLVRVASRVRSVVEQLSGSISERETLTAKLNDKERHRCQKCGQMGMLSPTVVLDLKAELEEICVLYESRRMSVNAVVDEARAAVARLTTERDTFRDWFQNAEQARAVAESKLASRSVTRCQKCGAEALPSPTHALDLEAERDDAREDVERLTTEKAQYDADLAAAAGELLVPIPEAGTDAARMLIANRLLKSQLAEAKRVREQAIQDIEALPSMRLVNMDNREVIARDEVRRILRGDE